MSTIKDRVRIVLSGLTVVPSALTRNWPLHGYTHENGGVDEISVDDLDGVLAEPQDAGWFLGTELDNTGLSDGDLYVYDFASDSFVLINRSELEGVLSLSSDDFNQRLVGHLRLTGGTNILIDELDDQSGYQISAIIADVIRTPSTVTTVAGSYVSGDTDSLADWDDGDVYRVNETNTTPGFEIQFDFTAVDGINKVTAYLYYAGPGALHSVHVEIYNYTTTSWTELGSFTIGSTWKVLEYPIPVDTNYINGSSEARVRILHDDPGNASHYILVDYVALVRAATSAGGVTDHGSLTGLGDSSDHLYAFLHDGTRAATGDFDMANHTISDVRSIEWHMDGVTPAEGEMVWDTDSGTLALGMPGGTVVMQVGQEMPFRSYNNSGSAISDGAAVRITGSSGNNPTVAVASNSSESTARVFGLATEPMPDSTWRFVTTHGLVNGLNTSGWGSGTSVWLTTGGGYGTTQPAAPATSTCLGHTVRDSATEGSIYVRPQVVPRLSYLSDVNVRAADLGEGQILAWDDTNQYWDYVPNTFITHTGARTVVATDLGAIELQDALIGSSTWTNPFLLAATVAEWTALDAAAGEHSLAWYLEDLYTGGGSSATLDSAYDGSGSGAGRLMTIDSGPVSMTNTGENVVLNIGSDSTMTAPLLTIDNDSTSLNAHTIFFSGDAGSPVDVDRISSEEYELGHRLYVGDGILMMVAEEAAAGHENTSTVCVRRGEYTNPDNYATHASLLSAYDTGSTYHYARIETYMAVTAASTWQPFCEINSSYRVDIVANNAVNITNAQIGYKRGSASWSPGTNTISVDWGADGEVQYVTITANATTVAFTDPGGNPKSLTLYVTASGGAYSVTGFSASVTWYGTYDPDAAAYTIPSGETHIFKFDYVATTDTYIGTVYPQVV